jgi:hypothetical protein
MHDSFYRWGFFNSVLKKSARLGLCLLEQWTLNNPDLQLDQTAVDALSGRHLVLSPGPRPCEVNAFHAYQT